jgi:hypothetical protein
MGRVQPVQLSGKTKAGRRGFSIISASKNDYGSAEGRNPSENAQKKSPKMGAL